MQGVFEKIIEKLEKEADSANDEIMMQSNDKDRDFQNGYANGLCRGLEIVKKEAEKYNNGWIPCDVRLPEQTKPFQTEEYTVTMVFVKNGKRSKPFTSHANFDYESEKWMVRDYEVIAWREQVEPYHPKEECE